MSNNWRRVFVAVLPKEGALPETELFEDKESLMNFLATHPGWVDGAPGGIVPCYCDPDGLRQL